MSDGCWVQFWDQTDFAGPTLRFDAEGPYMFVEDMDAYTQSDGSKEGDEPDSLKTGSRTWLVIYEKSGYGGKSAQFGPNSEIKDLHNFNKMRGEASSFKIYDTPPTGFVSSTGAPAAIESPDRIVNAQTVNDVLRTVVTTSVDSIPVVGGVISTLISGLWPDSDNSDQVWASAQNYLNQVIAGAYWQSVYEEMNDDLSSLYNAACDYTAAIDDKYKKSKFGNLLNLVNNREPHFIHEATPEDRYSFISPFVTLRLATLLEEVTHYEFYYGTPQDAKEEADVEEQKTILRAELNDAVDRYRRLLDKAKIRIVQARRELIRTDRMQGEYAVVDDYNGYRFGVIKEDLQAQALNFYADTVQYQLELKLEVHNAIGQLWEFFRPGAVETEHPGPLPAPTIGYRTGPYGAYNEVADYFDTGLGKLTQASLWSGNYVDAIQLAFGAATEGRCGGPGGSEKTLALKDGEVISSMSGHVAGMITEHGAVIPVYSPVPTKPIYEDDYPFYPVYQSDFIHSLTFETSQGRSLSGGSSTDVQFSAGPMPGTSNTRLTGIIGYKSITSDSSIELVSALICQWQCQLPFNEGQETA